MVNVDTKLLVIFVELLSKRNATYVAEKMHMTAPAVSHSLGRLREIFDDPCSARSDTHAQGARTRPQGA